MYNLRKKIRLAKTTIHKITIITYPFTLIKTHLFIDMLNTRFEHFVLNTGQGWMYSIN